MIGKIAMKKDVTNSLITKDFESMKTKSFEWTKKF